MNSYDTITSGMEINVQKTEQQRPETVGEATEAASSAPISSDGASPSDPAVLRKLYENMLACRMLRQRLQTLVQSGELNGVAGTVANLEAVEVGATFELKPEDALTIYQHDAITDTLKGFAWTQLFALLRNGQNAAAMEEALACNLIPAASSIAAQLSLAAGVALVCKRQRQRSVVMALCGGAIACLGSWHDAAKLAGDLRLPIIFVVESGRSATQSSPNWYSSSEHLSQRAHDYGFPGITVDGNDVVAVFRVAQESIHRARNGAGPTLIECVLSPAQRQPQYAANGSRGRAAKDPLAHMEHYLRKRKAWKDSWKQQFVEDIGTRIDQAIAGAGQRGTSSSRGK